MYASGAIHLLCGGERPRLALLVPRAVVTVVIVVVVVEAGALEEALPAVNKYW